jgi:RHS repeat-associated protein
MELLMKSAVRCVQVEFARYAVAFALILVANLLLGPREARAAVNPWNVCTPSNVTPGAHCTGLVATDWEYDGVQGYGHPPIHADSLAGLIAAVQADWLSSSNVCSISHTGTALHVPSPILWGPDPIIYLYGVDRLHQHQLTFQVISGVPANPCSTTTSIVVNVAQRRAISCPNEYSLVTDSAPGFIPYCARPWNAPDRMKCSSCKKEPAQPAVGNPIDVATGNKLQTETDYRGSGSSPLSFSRYYNSYFARINAPDPQTPAFVVGAAWQADYFQEIAYSTLSGIGTAFVYRPDSQRIIFSESGGAFAGPDDLVGVQLTAQRDTYGAITGWTLKLASDTVEAYGPDGKLLSITNRNGVSQTLAYDGSGQLASVTDSFGHQLLFSFTNGRLTGVTQPDGQLIQYAYATNGYLTYATDAAGNVRQYHYATSDPYLTGITDENSQRYSTYTYHSYYRHGLTTELAGGVNKYTINYNYSGDIKRAVTDPTGTSRIINFTINSGVQRFRDTASTCAGCDTSKSLTYDANGNTASRRDFNNNLTCYAYDLGRNLETVRVEGFAPATAACPAALSAYTPAVGTRERKVATVWHANYRIPTAVTEANRIVAFTHDTSGNVLTRTVTDTSVIPNVSRTWTYTYNSYGQVLTEDGPRTDVSDITTYTYYTCTTGFQCGQLNTITNALGHVTTYNSYNAHGQPTQITDANGFVTSLAYDARQRLTDRCTGGTLPLCSGGELTHLDYWPTGLLKKATNPDASYIEYTYDNAHRLTQINDGALNKIVYTLDNAGNRTAETTYDPSNALRRTHTRVFNTLNQLWKDVNAAGTANVTTIFGYDNNGNQTTTNAPLSRNSTSLYDELNRLKQITDPASGVTQFGYDANDNLTSVTDPRTLATTYTYTGFGDLKTQTSPDTGLTTNTYDSGGNLDTSTDSRGAITDYAYDASNRVTSASFTLGGSTDQAITYAYDAGTNQKGRLTSASDAGHSLAWTYDTHGRITGKGQTVGGVTLSIGYGYNASGQLSSTVLPSGSTLGFGYNTNGQVTSLTLNGSTTILNAITYDPFGPITSWTWGNGTAASRAFDTDGKITQVDNASGASLKNYAYDDAFRITGIADAGSSALSWTYGYDLLDRLNSASKTGTTQGWTYDANGNRLTETGSSPSTYTNAGTSNRVSSISGSLPRTYAYDAAGNTLSYAGATFTYNNRGRMVTATNGGVTATYTYNALGQRIKRTASGITTLYVYDEAGHLAGEYTSTGALIQETVWLGDIPVATLRPNGSGGVIVYYVHADHLNTPRLVTDTSNNLRWKWDSDPFGATQPNENPASLGAFTYNLRFPGQQYDAVVGLHYNYFRDYDPASGRYSQSDPIGLGGGINTYGYVSANPVMSIDPRGLAGTIPRVGPPGIVFPDVAIPGTPANDAWVRDASRAIDDLLNPSSSAEIIDFGKKKKERDEAKERERLKNCPPEDDGLCERDQKQLLSRQLLIVNMYRSNLVELWQYRIQVQNYNFDAEAHNRLCPDHQVALLPEPGPISTLD